MVQIYIIKLIQHPDVKSICLNQQQYDDLLCVTEKCDTSHYVEACFNITTVETLNNKYFFKQTILTCEQANRITSLAMYIHTTTLKTNIQNRIRNDVQAEK